MYCEFCGKKLENGASCDCPEAVKKMGSGKEKNNINIGGMTIKRMNPKMIIVVAVVLIAIIAGAFMSGGMKKIELVQYLDTEPDISGLNRKGIIHISSLFDASGLETDLIEGMEKISEEELEDMDEDDFALLFADMGERYTECEQAVDAVFLTVRKNGEEVNELVELSNGDVIEVEIQSVNPTNKYLKTKFKEGTVEFTVEGLMDGQAVDVFGKTGLKLNFVGVNGNGVPMFDYDQEALAELDFTFAIKDRTNGYCNGDILEVVVDYNEAAWEIKGYYLLEESKTFTVEGLASYISDLEEISEAQLEKLKANVETKFYEEAKGWREGVSVEGITYLGSYLMCQKEGVSSFLAAPNLLYMVYKIDVFENFSPNKGDDNHFSYYYYGGYEGVLGASDESMDLTITYETDCWDSFSREVKTSGEYLEIWRDLYYTGYETLEELVQDCVLDYADQYTYVTDVVVSE